MSSESAPQTNKEFVLAELAQSLGEQTLRTVEPSNDVVVPSETDSSKSPAGTFTPYCITQSPTPKVIENAPLNIAVGLDGTCPRWVPGSTVCWTSWSDGWRSAEDAKYATDQLKIASEVWNSHNVGIQFKWVPDTKDATFALAYGGDGPNDRVLASAFFPTSKDLNFMLVYIASFSDQYWYDNMWKTFAHELGHVLGLRHEFALDIIEDKEAGRFRTRETNPAVHFGARNASSVMNYTGEGPMIQQSDIDSTISFYNLRPKGGARRPKVEHLEVYDYKPM